MKKLAFGLSVIALFLIAFFTNRISKNVNGPQNNGSQNTVIESTQKQLKPEVKKEHIRYAFNVNSQDGDYVFIDTSIEPGNFPSLFIVGTNGVTTAEQVYLENGKYYKDIECNDGSVRKLTVYKLKDPEIHPQLALGNVQNASYEKISELEVSSLPDRLRSYVEEKIKSGCGDTSSMEDKLKYCNYRSSTDIEVIECSTCFLEMRYKNKIISIQATYGFSPYAILEIDGNKYFYINLDTEKGTYMSLESMGGPIVEYFDNSCDIRGD